MNTFLKIFFTVSLFFLSPQSLATGFLTKLPYENIDNKKLIELKSQGVKIIDIRLPEEWQETGIVEDSILITAFDKNGKINPDFLKKFRSEVKTLEQPVILICHTGSRTSLISQALASQLGYRKVYNVRNGILHWLAEKNSVVKANN